MVSHHCKKSNQYNSMFFRERDLVVVGIIYSDYKDKVPHCY